MFRPIRMDHTNCLQVAIKTIQFNFGKKERIKTKTRLEKQKYTQVYRVHEFYILTIRS
jgi:hypothetical protein